MKVIYEFNPDDEDTNDEFELSLLQIASSMNSALYKLDNIRRNLDKGYVYYDPKDDGDEDDKYARIDIERLIDDLSGVMQDSKIYDIE